MDPARLGHDGGAVRHPRGARLQLAAGLENDVYFQIGLLVLIGLGAKNALLRVTFAVELRKQGLSIMDATIQAGEKRLRPIIMTSLAFIFGVLPLAIAMGAGANARHSIGTGIIGGMIGETTLAMLYVPLFFYLFDSLGAAAQTEEGARRGGRGRRAPAARAGRRATDMRRSGRGSSRLPARRLHDRPRLQAPGRRRAAVVPLRGNGRPGHRQHRWWQQFDDPVLDGLIADALANNKSVQIAAANVEQAAAVLTQTKAPLFPQAGYGAERREAAGVGDGGDSDPAVRPEPPDLVPGARRRQLGARPLGPDPPPHRGRAGEPPRDRGGAPRRRPLPRRVGGEHATSSSAASTSSS